MKATSPATGQAPGPNADLYTDANTKFKLWLDGHAALWQNKKGKPYSSSATIKKQVREVWSHYTAMMQPIGKKQIITRVKTRELESTSKV